MARWPTPYLHQPPLPINNDQSRVTLQFRPEPICYQILQPVSLRMIPPFKASPVPPRTLPGKGSSKSVPHLSPKLNDTVLSPSKSSTDIEPLEAIKSFLLITCVVVSKNTLLFADCFRLDSEPPNIHFTMHPPPTVFTSSGGSFFLIVTTETAESAAMSIGLPALTPIFNSNFSWLLQTCRYFRLGQTLAQCSSSTWNVAHQVHCTARVRRLRTILFGSFQWVLRPQFVKVHN